MSEEVTRVPSVATEKDEAGNLHFYVALSTGRIEVRQIPTMLLNAKKAAIKRIYPKPKPPLRETKLGGRPHLIPEADNAWFKQELEEWEEVTASALNDYFYLQGVKSEPPEDFPSVGKLYEEYAMEPTPDNRKLLWLYRDVLASLEDVSDLSTAISELSFPDEKDVQEMERSFPGDS